MEGGVGDMAGEVWGEVRERGGEFCIIFVQYIPRGQGE